MPQPWFDPILFSWIPGTVFGVTCGVLGGLSGTFAPQGKARSLIVGSWITLIVISAVLLGLSAIAYLSGQPNGISYGFGLPGFIGLIVIPCLMPNLLQQYRKSEERTMQAQDLE